MSASPGWDHPQPPTPGQGRPPLDRSGEPVGYNLPGLPMYEQPPPRPQPFRVPPPATLAQQGLRLGVAGLVTSMFVITVPIAIAGVVVSSIALQRSQGGGADRGRAVAGLIVAILGILVTVLVILSMGLGS